MKKNDQIPRRSFLQTTALVPIGASWIVQNQSSSAELPGLKKGEMKLGCLCWNFRGIGDGPPWDEPIDIIGGMGFDAIELIVSRLADYENYWKKDSVISALKKKLDSYKLTVSQFVLFQTVLEEFSSLDADKRKRSLDLFEEGCKAAVKLNAPIINFVAPWARELKGPQEYLPRYFAVTKGAPEAKFHIDVPKGFDFDAVWETFVQTMKDAVQRAQHYGLRLTVENHTHTLVHDATAFLRLWDAVQSPALGINLDIGWIQLQREYPPLAIHKVKNHLMNLHLRDIDGVGLVFVGIGDGVMDFKAVIDTLKEIGYTGYLSFEQDGVPDMHAVIRHGKELIQKLIG